MQPYVYRRFVTVKRHGLLVREMTGWCVWSDSRVEATASWTTGNPISAWITRKVWVRG